MCGVGYRGNIAAVIMGLMGYETHNVKFGMMGWTKDDAVLATARFDPATQPVYRLETSAPTTLPTTGGLRWQVVLPYGLMAVGALSAGVGVYARLRKAA